MSHFNLFDHHISRWGRDENVIEDPSDYLELRRLCLGAPEEEACSYMEWASERLLLGGPTLELVGLEKPFQLRSTDLAPICHDFYHTNTNLREFHYFGQIIELSQRRGLGPGAIKVLEEPYSRNKSLLYNTMVNIEFKITLDYMIKESYIGDCSNGCYLSFRLLGARKRENFDNPAAWYGTKGVTFSQNLSCIHSPDIDERVGELEYKIQDKIKNLMTRMLSAR